MLMRMTHIKLSADEIKQTFHYLNTLIPSSFLISRGVYSLHRMIQLIHKYEVEEFPSLKEKTEKAQMARKHYETLSENWHLQVRHQLIAS